MSHSFDDIGQSVEKSIRKITNTLRAIAMGVLVMLMFLGTADVIGRYLFDKPIKGVYSISEVMLVVVVFFGWAYTLSVGKHVKIDTVFLLFPPRVRTLSGVITSVIALVTFSLITWQSALRAMNSQKAHEIIDILEIPVYPFQFLVSVGSFALCLELIVQILQSLNQLRRGS